MHCYANSSGQESSFLSQHTFIFAGPLLPNRFDRANRHYFQTYWPLTTATAVFRWTNISGTRHEVPSQKNGNAGNWYHVTNVMWTAAAGDGSQIFSPMHMRDPGRFPFSQKFRKFGFEAKWKTFFRFARLENSQKKWNCLEGSPGSSTFSGNFPVGRTKKTFSI